MNISIGVAGGQGLIGRGVCTALIEGGRVDRVISLDLRATGAIKGVEERIIDVHDKDAFVKELEDLDLVVNIVAPYYRHGTDVADAAFEAGIHYTDACADIEITKTLLAKNETWKNADITLLTGLGASPGITNLLVKLLASRFDEVLEAHVIWFTGGGDSGDREEGAGTLEDFIREEFGEIPTYVDGRFIMVTGFYDGVEEVRFGEHTVTVYHSGHSEPITIPRYFPNIRAVSCKGNVVPYGLTNLIQKAVEIGLNSDKTIKVMGHKIAPINFLTAYVSSNLATSYYDLESIKIPGGIQVRVVGIRNGKEETEIETLSGENEARGDGMTRSTAVPIAVVSEAIVHGEIERRGAYAPEALDTGLVEKILNDIMNRM